MKDSKKDVPGSKFNEGIGNMLSRKYKSELDDAFDSLMKIQQAKTLEEAHKIAKCASDKLINS